MANEPTTASTANPPLPPTRVYALAVICLVAGLPIGYLLRGSQSPVSVVRQAASAVVESAPAGAMRGGDTPSRDERKQVAGQQPVPAVNAAPPSHLAMGGGRMPSPEELKRMADMQAAPLVEKLKSDPSNTALLIQAGAIYHAALQFREAAAYYGRAVRVDPANAAFRIKLASSLFRGGDVDGAIAQLNRALVDDPKNANALFDLGMIRLRGKKDGKGALADWQRLLKSNPQLSPDRKAAVLKLMADVMTTLGDRHGIEGAPRNDGH
jgi:cytochrome c-type biogenesis protein CcmH/NrfG